ncbi:MAG: AmmeMemoRadiSam system protein B [Bacteroidales bacterium]|jgi:hypothetical protein|nr:AmmeMemoRadiSam system protein B [Bacteroidales bacterium]
MDRKPAVAGSFYPEHPIELKKEIETLFKCTNLGADKDILALISPHAGYLFSGGVAASAFAQINPDTKYKRVFIIGSSHTCVFKGASIYCNGDFLMPYGKEIVDKELGEKLVYENPSIFTANPTPHFQEHSLEVQLPFLNHILKNGYMIVPIIIGTEDPAICKKIATALEPWLNPENLFVISTDFSHYPCYTDAITTDKKTMEAILSKEPANLLKVLKENSQMGIKGLSTSLCGASSVLVLIYLTQNNPNIKYRAIEYKNSGDNSRYGDRIRVVGYWSIAVYNEFN